MNMTVLILWRANSAFELDAPPKSEVACNCTMFVHIIMASNAKYEGVSVEAR